MSDYRKCKIVGSSVERCDALEDSTELGGSGTRYQGVKSVSLVNNKTFKFARTLTVLKSGKHAKQGLFMNFCPFCGESILAPSEAEAASDEPKPHVMAPPQ